MRASQLDSKLAHWNKSEGGIGGSFNPDWKQVTNGMPQGTMLLGWVHSCVYINNLDDDIVCVVRLMVKLQLTPKLAS